MEKYFTVLHFIHYLQMEMFVQDVAPLSQTHFFILISHNTIVFWNYKIIITLHISGGLG